MVGCRTVHLQAIGYQLTQSAWGGATRMLTLR